MPLRCSEPFGVIQNGGKDMLCSCLSGSGLDNGPADIQNLT